MVSAAVRKSLFRPGTRKTTMPVIVRSRSLWWIVAALTGALLTLPARAEIHNGFHVSGDVNGNVFNLSGALSNDGPGISKVEHYGGITAEYFSNAKQFTAAKASVAGTGTVSCASSPLRRSASN